MDAKGKLFKESLKKIDFLFRLSGIPLQSSEKHTWKSRLLFFWHFINILAAVLGAIHFFCSGVAKGEEFIKLTFMAPCICFTLLSIVKALTLVLNRSKIFEIIDSLVEMEEKTEKYTKDAKDIYKENRNALHKLLRYVNAVYLALLIAFLLSPFTIMALNYFEGKLELVYPFSLSYPFDAYRVELYPVVYLEQAESIVVVLMFTTAADYFFYTCCLYISIYFKLLQLKFENLISDNSLRITFEDVEADFVELVEWHQRLISITNLLEAVYAKSTLYNFVSSSALICLTLFDVTAIKDLAFSLTFLFFLSMCLTQIFLLCYFGDKVTRASTEVNGAVFNSLWYKCNASVGKHLHLVLMRSQKPCKLTAFGFADVNQRAFMRILSNAWSYFALLKTMYR